MVFYTGKGKQADCFNEFRYFDELIDRNKKLRERKQGGLTYAIQKRTA